jgi:GT2 family glycosyltransferase
LVVHAGDDFGLVGPRVLESDGRVADAARGLITPWEIIARRIKPRSPLRYPAWMAGMFLMVRSEAYKGVGGFDERYHLYCEDFDLCARVRLLGWPIGLSDDARVVHDARRASHDSPRHLFWHVCSLVMMWSSRSWWRYRRLLRREAPNRVTKTLKGISAQRPIDESISPITANQAPIYKPAAWRVSNKQAHRAEQSVNQAQETHPQ